MFGNNIYKTKLKDLKLFLPIYGQGEHTFSFPNLNDTICYIYLCVFSSNYEHIKRGSQPLEYIILLNI